MDELADYLELSPEAQKKFDRQKQEAMLEEPPPFLLIEHETLSKVFYRKGLSRTHLNELYSPRILRDVQHATNCRLELDEVAGSVSVKGDSEENLNKAIAKLNALEKMDVGIVVTCVLTSDANTTRLIDFQGHGCPTTSLLIIKAPIGSVFIQMTY